jgi:hypothetical protein
MLGNLLATTAFAVPSFRAECPVFLVLREAPGHAVEESLFDVSNNRPLSSGGVLS